MRQSATAELAARHARGDARASLVINLAGAVLGFAVLLWVRLHPAGDDSHSLASALLTSLGISAPVLVSVVSQFWSGRPRRLGLRLTDVQSATVVRQDGKHLVLDVGVDRVDVRVESTRGRTLRSGDIVGVPRGGSRPALVVMREAGRFGRHTLWAAGR